MIITTLWLFMSSSAFAGAGAIAYSKSDDVIGLSYGSGSQADASRWALLDCRDKGGADCQIKVFENDACAAIAIGNRRGLGYAWWSHPFRELEEKRSQQVAIAKCAASGDTDCKVRGWVCH
jgi:hypothetical protein